MNAAEIARFSAIREATKRARHFTRGKSSPRWLECVCGPFTPIKSALGANHCLLLDATDLVGGDLVGDLFVIDLYAKAINRACEAERIDKNPEIIEAMAGFLSRLWFDPLLLTADK